MKYHVFISATEVSADNIGAKFISGLKSSHPNTFRFSGWGGPNLKKEGIDLIGDVCSSNSVGITEAIPFLWKSFKFLRISKRFFRENSINLLLCVDGQGKNLPLSKIAKNMGIKVAYILPPPVFIWCSYLKRKLLHIDLLICLFPQNFRILSQHHPNVILLKHPLFSNNNEIIDNYTHRSNLIGIFPGSRKSEIQRLLPDMLKTFELLTQKVPNLQAILCVAHPSFVELIKNLVPKHLPIQILLKPASNILQQCKVAILASGTITLQALECGTPSVVVYRLSLLSSLIGRFFVRKEYFSLPNILLDKIIFPEFFNSEISYKKITEILLPYLQGPQDMSNLLNSYRDLIKNMTIGSQNTLLLGKYILKISPSGV